MPPTSYQKIQPARVNPPGWIALWLGLPLSLVRWILLAECVAVSLGLLASEYYGMDAVSQQVWQWGDADFLEQPGAGLITLWPTIKTDLSLGLCADDWLKPLWIHWSTTQSTHTHSIEHLLSLDRLAPLMILILKIMALVTWRAAWWLSTLPLWLLAYWIGVVDGLVARDCRRFNGARESAWQFHRYHASLWPWMQFSLGLTLCLPIQVAAEGGLLLSVSLFALLSRQTAAYFKKYS